MSCSLHGCVLNPLLPSLFRVSCPILTGYLRTSFQTGAEVKSARGKLCCSSFPYTEKRLVNGVESILWLMGHERINSLVHTSNTRARLAQLVRASY